MNRFIPFLALLFFPTAYVAAQAPSSDALLWEVTGNKLEAPSYLFGTFHILCASDFSVDGILQEKLSQAEQLYLELDFSDPQLQGQMMQHAAMRNDTTLSQFFTDDEFAHLAETFQALTGNPLTFLQRLKPALLVSMVIVPMLDCELTGVEVALMSAIDMDQTQVKGLETVARQMAVFDDIPYSVQAKQLQESLLKQDSIKQAMDQLVALYKSEDIVGMLELTESDPSMADFSKVLLEDRNTQWIPIMEEAMHEKATFFAVGAAHLAGEMGVIHLLRQAGYQVEPVRR